MKTLIALALIIGSTAAFASERKPIEDVDLNRLIEEIQVMGGANDSVELIWWIPQEFWETTLTQDPTLSSEQTKAILDVLRPYTVIAAVQADITPMGSFKFFDRDRVASGLGVEVVRPGGKTVSLPQGQVTDSDVKLLLEQMRPILAAALGNLGQNFHFFALNDLDEDGNRIASPYEEGVLRAQLMPSKGGATVLEIPLPLDALMVPRICPNGKPAHVSWSYCPWSGEKL